MPDKTLHSCYLPIHRIVVDWDIKILFGEESKIMISKEKYNNFKVFLITYLNTHITLLFFNIIKIIFVPMFFLNY